MISDCHCLTGQRAADTEQPAQGLYSGHYHEGQHSGLSSKQSDWHINESISHADVCLLCNQGADGSDDEAGGSLAQRQRIIFLENNLEQLGKVHKQVSHPPTTSFRKPCSL